MSQWLWSFFFFFFCLFCFVFQISYGSSSPILSNRKRFPNFFRLVMPDQKLNAAKIAMMKKYNWKKVATINQALEFFSVVCIWCLMIVHLICTGGLFCYVYEPAHSISYNIACASNGVRLACAPVFAVRLKALWIPSTPHMYKWLAICSAYDPAHSISYKTACVPRGTRRLVQSIGFLSEDNLDPKEYRSKTNQTVLISRLIFSRRTWSLVEMLCPGLYYIHISGWRCGWLLPTTYR